MKRVRSDFRAPTLRISVQSNDLKPELPACYTFPVCLVEMFRLCGHKTEICNETAFVVQFSYNFRVNNKTVMENVGELKIN